MIEIAADEWLTRVAGMPCFRLPVAPANRNAFDPADFQSLRQKLPRGAAFVYAKLPPAMVGTVSGLCSAGFALVDTNLILELGSPMAAATSVPPGEGIRRATPADHAAAQSVAGSCFEYSRFHLDPLFPAQTANTIKREWVRSYCEGSRGTELLIADRGGRVAGFLAVLTHETAGKRIAVIDLVGVDRAFQRQGVGDALVARFIADWRGKTDLLRVGTQLANGPSLRLYQGRGFHVVDSAYVLHGHFRDGVPRR